MLNSKAVLALGAVLILALSFPVLAQPTDTVHGGTFGLGFQASFPAYGASAIVRVTDQVAVQAILGAFGELHSYYGRVIYRFNPKQPSWGRQNLYGYGMVGSFSYPSVEADDSGFGVHKTREWAPGFGAGVGLEAFLESMPQIGWTIEVGFGSVNFKDVDYNFSLIELGVGIHYYFGGGR